jgi:hypothetical protein
MRANDWKAYIDAQVTSTKKQDRNEAEVKRLSKSYYKSIIDSQLEHKKATRAYEASAKEEEALKVYKSLDDYQQFRKNQREAKNQRQTGLFRDYSNQLLMNAAYRERRNNVELTLEKKLVRENEMIARKQKEIELNRKFERIKAENEFIQEKNREKQNESIKQVIETHHDKELIDESMNNSTKYQKEYANTLKKIADKQSKYEAVYQQVMKNNKIHHRTTSALISKWEAEALNKSIAIDAIEKEKKARQKKIEHQTLKNQINEKIKAKLLAKEDTSKEKDNMDLTLLRYKFVNEKEKTEQTKKKEHYKAILDHQIREKQVEEQNKDCLTFKEKEYHGYINEKVRNNEEIDFKGIPGVYRSQSTLRTSFMNDRKLCQTPLSSMENESFIEHSGRKSTLKTSHSIADFTKHDPILNPIGTSFEHNANYHRGKGLKYLNN